MIRADATEGRPGGGFTDYFVIDMEKTFSIGPYKQVGRLNQEVIYDLE